MTKATAPQSIDKNSRARPPAGSKPNDVNKKPGSKPAPQPRRAKPESLRHRPASSEALQKLAAHFQK